VSAVAARVRSSWRIGCAFLRMDAIEDFSYPMSVVFQQASHVLPVIVYFFVARLFTRSGGAEASAVGDYYSFAVVGLSAAALLQMALSGFGTQLQYAQDRGTLETLLTEPIPWLGIPFAMNLWRTATGMLSCVIMLGLGALLGADLRLAGLPTFLAVAALGTLACTAVGILSASLMVLAKRAAPLLTLYGLVASLFAGALFPIDLVPGWLRWISYLVPHTYVIAVSRQVLMAQPPLAVIPLDVAFWSLTAFTLSTFAVGLFLFGRALQYARKMGLLSGY
jgi:ABC-2 type transport system permease protein